VTVLTGFAPSYIPWKGLFDRISKADIFVLTDTDRYSPKDFHNRNRIILHGKPHWLTVPVLGGRDQRLMAIEVDDRQPWRRKHKGALISAYGKALFWDPTILDVYDEEFIDLAYLNAWGIGWMLAGYGLNLPVHCVSQYPDITGEGSERILNMCKHFDADTYLCGANGRNYLDFDSFKREGVEVRVEDYQGEPVSALHHLFTEGAVL